MLTLIASILGAVTSAIPQLIDVFDRKNRLDHEREMLEIKISAAKQKVEMEIDLANAKADIQEGDSLRHHDSTLVDSSFIGHLRASVRPVITYTFFILFVVIKCSALYIFLRDGIDIASALIVIWDVETSAIFGAIMGFWFGSRILQKLREPLK